MAADPVRASDKEHSPVAIVVADSSPQHAIVVPGGHHGCHHSQEPRRFGPSKVDDGYYSTKEEVVADALHLMQARDEAARIGGARLKDAIERGYEDVVRGRIVRLNSDDDIDAFFADLSDGSTLRSSHANVVTFAAVCKWPPVGGIAFSSRRTRRAC